jgi:cation diffusion facilitator CzcD-associated flavoprotein CzcO
MARGDKGARRPQVVIVGAGFAGLSVANRRRFAAVSGNVPDDE